MEIYKKTKYKVSNGMDVEFGIINQEFNTYVCETGYDNFCYVTAYNPFSVLKKEVYNKKADTKLFKDINGRFKWLRCKSYNENHPEFDEFGYIIFNIGIDNAVKLMEKYKQNAILYSIKNEAPYLLYNKNI